MTEITRLILSMACVIVGVVAAVIDVRSRRIPNTVSLLLLLLALPIALLAGGVGEVGSHLLHAVIALLAGMALFSFGMIGGGDAKLYAASALAFPLSQGFALLGWTSLVGLTVLVAMMAYHRRLPLRKAGKSPFSVPYGVAIAGGMALAFGPQFMAVLP